MPCRVKHLTLRNRALVPTLPKGAGGSPGPCRVERAKGGLALTMAAGPAIVSPNAVLAFGILAAHTDAVMRRVAYGRHAYGRGVAFTVSRQVWCGEATCLQPVRAAIAIPNRVEEQFVGPVAIKRAPFLTRLLLRSAKARATPMPRPGMDCVSRRFEDMACPRSRAGTRQPKD